MKRQLTEAQRFSQSIMKDFRDTLWSPFMRGIRRYELIQPGDHIAVCISGGKDSMLLALMLQQLQRHSEVPFRLTFLSMDPGYAPANRQLIQSNADRMGIPIQIFDSDVFEAAESQSDHPCFLCARMRRGCLYNKAAGLGCNKIALGHHFNDIVQTTLMAMLWSAKLEAMRPILPSRSHPGLTLIRPMALIHEEDIIAWRDAMGLTFLRCACRFSEQTEHDITVSRRAQTKALLQTLRLTNPDVEKNIFNAIHHVDADTMPGWQADGVGHGFWGK